MNWGSLRVPLDEISQGIDFDAAATYAISLRPMVD
jgi:hypothetical protein